MYVSTEPIPYIQETDETIITSGLPSFLIDKKKSKGETGIPGLSKIPIIGNLFKSKANSATDREVIIVLTPHIIDSKEKSFSYVIPKDSETFDSFNNVLFRNAYRIRDDDLFDLSFATQSEYFKNILDELKDYKTSHPEIADDAPLFSYLDKKVPGEEVIVTEVSGKSDIISSHAKNFSDSQYLGIVTKYIE